MDTSASYRTTEPTAASDFRTVQPIGDGSPTTNMNRLQIRETFAHEIPVPTAENKLYESCVSCFGACFGFLSVISCSCCCPNPYQTVHQGSVGLVSKFGKYYKAVDPGLYLINIFTEKVQSVNVKLRVEDIPSQVVTTQDNVTVSIDSVLYWHIVNPQVATYSVDNVRSALVERTQTTLRTIMGHKTLQQGIEHRDSIADEIERIIGPAAEEWGINVEAILIKDLKYSADLQENLSSAAKQKRIGESKVIAAQAEVDAAKLMREAADILNSSAAMQIRYLDTLQNMSKTSGAKVIFLPPSSSELETAIRQHVDSGTGTALAPGQVVDLRPMYTNEAL
ncbi:MAG: hypothetical protein SGCHY_003085 [Lobulomycetales sp.]